jgi:hypothetical protein
VRKIEFLAESWNHHPYRYVTCCVDGGHGPGGEAIHDMEDRSTQISFDEFMNEVGDDQMVRVFPSYNWPEVGHTGYGLSMQDDYTMKEAFHRSTWYGIPCVYCVNSAIEYIFTKDGREPEDLDIDRNEYLANLDEGQNMAPHGAYAYHCTFEANLPGIRQHGLVPGQEPNWDMTRDGWLYATDHNGAEWYRDELSAFEQPLVIIRFPMPETKRDDDLGNFGDFMFDDVIPPDQIEVESEPGGRFVPLGHYELALNEVAYEPELPYRDEIAVPLLDRSYSQAKNRLKKIGTLNGYDLMLAETDGLDATMFEFFLVRDGNPRGEITLSAPQGKLGERRVFDVYVMPEARGVGYKLYCFLLDHGYVLRSGRSHTLDSRRMWLKLAMDPRYDVRMNYDKPVENQEDLEMAYQSPIYFLTASKAHTR